MAYTASVPRVTCCQTPSANLSLTGAASFAMSASTSLLTRVGSAWYSTWARSGGLPAFEAVSSLVTMSPPPACLLSVTWMSGFAAFQASTVLSMFGAQAQNESSTLPPVCAGWSASPESLVQAALRPAARTTASSLAPNLALMVVTSPQDVYRCERSQP